MSHKNLAFATIHSTYSTVSVGLFIEKKLVNAITVDHKSACTSLLGSIEQLLTAQQLTLRDLSFIAVNQGPGPYTTLRITLTIANGLAFATGIPLVGVDGFRAFITELKKTGADYDYTVIIFNAFCREAYYAIHENATDLTETGYLPIADCVEKLNALGNKKVLIAGNGVTLFAKELALVTTPLLQTTSPSIETPSLEAIGKTAHKNWESGSGVSVQLLPLYLKKPAYHMSAAAPSQQ